MWSMDQMARRIGFLKSKLEELALRKQRLDTMMSARNQSSHAYGLWAKRLNWVHEEIRKHTAELARLEYSAK
jgi:hypothetical protein